MSNLVQLGLFERIKRFLNGYKSPPKPLYSPLPKFYLFNETGNILICTSAERVQGFDEYVKEAFTDVSVFFSAMTKALATTQPTSVVKSSINTSSTKASSEDKEKAPNLSIYNYQAMKDMFAHSNMFVETNAEHGLFVSKKVGETLGKDFVQTALGRVFDERTLNFTRAMFSGMSSQQNAENRAKVFQRGGHVFFICEMLNGLPTTSVVLVSIEPFSAKEKSIDPKKNEIVEDKSDGINILEFGTVDEKLYEKKQPKPFSKTRTWRYRKRSYLFVPPNYIKHASRLLNTAGVEGYDALVEELSNPVKNSLKQQARSNTVIS